MLEVGFPLFGFLCRLNLLTSFNAVYHLILPAAASRLLGLRLLLPFFGAASHLSRGSCLLLFLSAFINLLLLELVRVLDAVLGHGVAASVVSEVLPQSSIHGQRQGLLLGDAVLWVDAEGVLGRQVAVDADRLRAFWEVRVVGVLRRARRPFLVEAHVFVELVKVDEAAPLRLVKLAELVHDGNSLTLFLFWLILLSQ